MNKEKIKKALIEYAKDNNLNLSELNFDHYTEFFESFYSFEIERFMKNFSQQNIDKK